jgi:hypothetical protein
MSGDQHRPPFPESLPASVENPAFKYRLVPAQFAVHGSDSAVDSADATLHFPAENIAVHSSANRARVKVERTQSVGPVYESSPGGSLAVPTGSILVRFATPAKLEDKASQLKAAGYCIEQVLSYAPNAGWVKAQDGTIATSLKGIAKLAAIPGVEEVAPQMLSRAARKS